MRRQEIDVRVHTTADAATVYALLVDGAGWPAWSPVGSFELERAGEGGPEGVGAVRIFRTPRPTGQVVAREQVVERVPDRRFSYVMLSGLPIRDYRADVDLTPSGAGGTDIRWHSTFRAKVPGTGWLIRRILGDFIARTARGLAAHAAAG